MQALALEMRKINGSIEIVCIIALSCQREVRLIEGCGLWFAQGIQTAMASQ